ncbi:hypothetical protein QCM80_33110, partial [Bradyrhizobium sp. SSUT112]|uniref:hypothetical protein n=1 Tax=Bradyrhizobium sp. SSUT112 TaxID=3040604 RepID=UPI00244A014B
MLITYASLQSVPPPKLILPVCRRAHGEDCVALIEPRNFRFGSRLCKNAAPHHLHATKAAVGVAIEFAARASRPHGCQQWLDAE